MARIINFVSATGGVGKSSLIFLSSQKLAQMNYKVCIIDGVFGLNSYSKIVEAKVDLKDYLCGKVTREVLNKIDRNLYLVKSDCLNFDYSKHLKFINYLIEEISNYFDFIFIDSNALDKLSFCSLLSVSSEVLMIVTDNEISLQNNAKLCSEILFQNNILNFKIIVNKARIIKEINEKVLGKNEIEKILKRRVLFVVPKLYKNNFIVLSKTNNLNNKILTEFCYSLITNEEQKFEHQKYYKGLVGFIRRKIYEKFE